VKTVPLEETTLTLPELAEMAKEGPVILTRNGQPLVAVSDVSGSDWESISLAQNPRFAALIEESRRSYRDSGGIRLDDLRQELGLKSGPRRRATGSREEET
jgi:PHD/YefM family antitoxin component YafN of YafNO toxin-antitoxin module